MENITTMYTTRLKQHLRWPQNRRINNNNNNNNKKPRSTMFLRHRLSIAIQRRNAACLLGTLRPVVGGSYINYYNYYYCPR